MKFLPHAVSAFLAIHEARDAAGFSASKRMQLPNQHVRGQRRMPVVATAFGARKTSLVPLFGILDEVMGEDYNLMSSSQESDIDASNYEIFLGDLVFSTNDPRLDIIENYERATDPAFLEWMEKKSQNSNDPDERLALNDLLDMILRLRDNHRLPKT